MQPIYNGYILFEMCSMEQTTFYEGFHPQRFTRTGIGMHHDRFEFEFHAAVCIICRCQKRLYLAMLYRFESLTVGFPVGRRCMPSSFLLSI